MLEDARSASRTPVDLNGLQAHLIGLGDQPVLAAADTTLPDSLRDMLTTFAGREVHAAAGVLDPRIDSEGKELTLAVTCAAGGAWPSDATATATISAMTVVVTKQGAVTLTLNGEFDATAVVATVTEDDTGAVTGAVRSTTPGAFQVATLVARLAAGDSWSELESGLRELDLSVGQATGFDYRLERTPGADPIAYTLRSSAVTAALPLHDLTFDIWLWLQDKYIEGSLHATSGGKTDVATLLAAFGLPTDVPSGLDVRELDFSGGFGETYQLALGLEGSWAVGPFDIEKLSARIAYDTEEKFVAGFSGTVGIDSAITVEIDAAKSADASGGWTFEGGLPAGDALTMAAVVTALNLTGVPEVVRSLELTSLWFAHTTGTEKFHFTCQGDIDITESVTATIGVSIDRDSAQTRYGGVLRVGEFELDLVFDTGGGTEAIVAAYHSTAEAAEVEVHDWVADFSADLAAVVPDGLRVDLIDAKVVRVKPGGKTASLAVGFDLSADIDLSGLPLVGGFLSEAGTLGIDGLQVLYSTGIVDAATAAAVNTLLGSLSVLPIPAAGLKSGLAVQASLRLGGRLVPVALGLPAGQSAPQTALAAADTAPSSNSTGVWVQVQKQLGVLQINRVGLIYQHNALLFALDAAVTLGPLTLSFDGLGVGSPLEEFAPTFALSGLGVSFTNPAVTITGGLLHVPDPPAPIDFQYDGAAVVETSKFSLAAIGSYAQLSGGAPSLFVFAQLDVPLGEPPLVVSALMAGFGFNRKLTMPTAAQVPGFPLLILDAPGQKAMHVLDVLEGRASTPDGTTRQWIAPLEGNYWLAVGAQLTVFEVVTATVVLAAEFGQDLIFALLGTAVLQLPLKDEGAVRYVYAELGLEATLRPTDGIAQVQAQLSPASYVLTPDCHVTGGFAAAVWFGSNPNAGQFVVTLGGYHPAFQPPSCYPTVPRLGIRWAVSDAVSVTADAYLAVTPSCAMAGTDLRVLFHAGPVKAWFNAQADLLVSWRPFFFLAGLSIEIGASVTISVFGIQKTIGASVGASLRLWGPPTGGTVTAHIVVFTVTISFGDDGRGGTSTPLTWSEVAAMLPERDKVIGIVAVNGLDATIADGESTGGNRWLVRARDLRFSTGSAIPASHLRIGDTPWDTAQSGDLAGVDIRPMNKSALAGVHRLRVRHDDRLVDTSGWTITADTRNLPASLWGAPPSPFGHTPDAPSADTVPDLPVGFSVQAPLPVLADSRGVFPLSEYDDEELPPGLSPLPRHSDDNRDYVLDADPDVMDYLGEIATDPVREQRDAVFAALADAGLYTGGNDAMTALAAAAGHLYSQAPMVEKVGSPT
ncbi:DUF6603 domain-containing protein [Nocardia bovistercoris]|uniref:DUF6603 domain-containing protein n=1 Tax=Nocardia bovistercoris TaxID=2785916 RepID=A0A931IDJ1_9NOCA|nr:DUF6603 domain-containing protein [Nocardia bovistercoris]MBH0779469.1 hypothetical protein [Nocardia bovistercoris]